MTLKAGDASVAKPATELGLGIDYGASVIQAGGRKTFNPVEMIEALSGGKAVGPVVTSDAAHVLCGAKSGFARGRSTSP